MTRVQRWITLSILLLLAAASALTTIHVLDWQKKEQLEIFQNRFENPAEWGFTSSDGVEMLVENGQLNAFWEDTQKDALCIAAERLPEASGHEICVNVYTGGKQNAWARKRWGYQVWLELLLYRDAQMIVTQRAELPMESNKGRARPCTVRAAAKDGFDACGLRVWIMPVDGTIAAGEFTLGNWEVEVH